MYGYCHGFHLPWVCNSRFIYIYFVTIIVVLRSASWTRKKFTWYSCPYLSPSYFDHVCTLHLIPGLIQMPTCSIYFFFFLVLCLSWQVLVVMTPFQSVLCRRFQFIVAELGVSFCRDPVKHLDPWLPSCSFSFHLPFESCSQ